MDAEVYNQTQMDSGKLNGGRIVQLVRHFQRASGLDVDGKCGPETLSHLHMHQSPARFGLNPGFGHEVLTIAREYIGKGEVGGNNQGHWVALFKGEEREDVDLGPWCAAFLSFVIKTAAEARDKPLPFRVSQGAKRLYKNVGAVGGFTSTPQPGMLVCWDRGDVVNGKKNVFGHIGIVESVIYDADGLVEFTSIEGNKGSFRRTQGKVRRIQHYPGNDRLEGFAILPEV